ncbi:hypothetical protein DICVIV_10964 [Dictyocaulus viviparus]|uniref:Uncharacterized protein n=1 Tax=Dictyocaulus viviparus TaxID=29172 RepID=A0A0D8XL14_DICVI|nr:hypothetical protein DICVIV_10964 [Dictyocaulus viviparus]
MDDFSILNGILIGWFIAFWLCARLIDDSIPFISFYTSRYKNSIECITHHSSYSFTRENYHRRVDESCGTALFLRENMEVAVEHLNSSTAVTLEQWLLQQIRMDYLFVEVLCCQYVWLTVFGVYVAAVISHWLIFDPSITMISASTEYLSHLKSVHVKYISEMKRKFILEKLLVLAFVLVRNRDDDYSSDISLSTNHQRVTVASVFAIWFILVWSVFGMTVSVKHRFERILDLLSNQKTSGNRRISDKEIMVTDQEVIDGKFERNLCNTGLLKKYLILMLIPCLLTSTTMTSFGLTSFKLVHFLYAIMLTVEGLDLLVHSLHITYRVVVYGIIPDVVMWDSGVLQKTAYKADLIAGTASSALAVLRYLLYLVSYVLLLFAGKNQSKLAIIPLLNYE